LEIAFDWMRKVFCIAFRTSYVFFVFVWNKFDSILWWKKKFQKFTIYSINQSWKNSKKVLPCDL